MKKLTQSIIGKERWSGLSSYIDLVDANRSSNPNAALDGAKSILESISKTILEDKAISYAADSNVGFLIKKAFEALPVFSKLSQKDLGGAKSILGSFENITKVVGEFRTRHGFFSHGQDLQSEKFDRYLVELAISSADLLASFLVTAHAEDLKDRSRIYYEENEEFNRYIDESSESYPVVRGIQIPPSQALFTDEEAYKQELATFVNEKTGLIDRLEKSATFVSTRSIACDLIELREYLTDDEIKRITRACINNDQIYCILGHGYTKNLFTWVLEEKNNVLSQQEREDLEKAFSRKMY